MLHADVFQCFLVDVLNTVNIAVCRTGQPISVGGIAACRTGQQNHLEEPSQILLLMFSAVSMTVGAGQPKKSFNRVIVFADNAGADILLGILPLVRSDPVQIQ